jgi:hypothetical protein
MPPGFEWAGVWWYCAVSPFDVAVEVAVAVLVGGSVDVGASGCVEVGATGAMVVGVAVGADVAVHAVTSNRLIKSKTER